MITLSLFSGCGPWELNYGDGGQCLHCPHFPRLYHSGAMDVQGERGRVGSTVWAEGAEWAPYSLFNPNAINTTIHFLQRQAEAGCPDLEQFLVNFIFSALIISNSFKQHLLHSLPQCEEWLHGGNFLLTIFFLINTLKLYEENHFYIAFTAAITEKQKCASPRPLCVGKALEGSHYSHRMPGLTGCMKKTSLVPVSFPRRSILTSVNHS